MAQQINRSAIVPLGGYASGFDFTLGETFSTTMINGNSMLTLGMQQMDKTLTTTISEIGAGKKIDCTVFPNPTSGKFSLKINSTSYENLIVKLYDAFGKLVLTETRTIGQGSFETVIDPGVMPSGIYLISLSTANSLCTLKLLVN